LTLSLVTARRSSVCIVSILRVLNRPDRPGLRRAWPLFHPFRLNDRAGARPAGACPLWWDTAGARGGSAGQPTSSLEGSGRGAGKGNGSESAAFIVHERVATPRLQQPLRRNCLQRPLRARAPSMSPLKRRSCDCARCHASSKARCSSPIVSGRKVRIDGGSHDAPFRRERGRVSQSPTPHISHALLVIENVRQELGRDERGAEQYGPQGPRQLIVGTAAAPMFADSPGPAAQAGLIALRPRRTRSEMRAWRRVRYHLLTRARFPAVLRS
jgi:hypothetical protein